MTSTMSKWVKGELKAKTIRDEGLWYPPLGLMKLSTFHKKRGDSVRFVRGCDQNLLKETEFSSERGCWDRIYITTLFTYHWKKIIRTIDFYIDVAGGDIERVFVGGIMSSLMEDDIYQETKIRPVKGALRSPKQIGLDGRENIDLLLPDYSMLNDEKNLYAIHETFYAYTSRGCVNACKWCGVPKIEPDYIPYIDVKDMIYQMRDEYGDKPTLKLMDNNVLASPHLHKTVSDLITLGYGRSNKPNTSKKAKVVDFNQGLDASYFNNDTIKLISELNIKPMRIAFDRMAEKQDYINAVKLAKKHGFNDFSNYMLFNWNDSPRDLHERLKINIDLNQKWRNERKKGDKSAKIFCYPMRYAPINEKNKVHENRKRDYVKEQDFSGERDLLKNASWTKRFIRNVEIMKSAVHGAISSTPSLALRTIGENYEEFIANLYMPAELLRNRNKYEKRIYEHEPERVPGTGDVEKFRKFVIVHPYF